MPGTASIVDFFSNLDKVPLSDIRKWLRVKIDPHVLENFIANRILYPSTVPVDGNEVEIDLAFFREAVSLEPKKLYDSLGNKLVIPSQFLSTFGSLQEIVFCILEVVKTSGIVGVYNKDERGINQIGTIVSPKVTIQPETINVMVNGTTYQLKNGYLSLVPATNRHAKVRILDDEEIFVSGGDLGIIFDFRKDEVKE